MGAPVPKIGADRPKPNNGNGRPKGAVNKTTKLAKEAIAAAAEKLGGEKRLVAWAKESAENERIFWQSIYTKLIPVQTEITGADGGAIQFEKVRDDADAFVRSITGIAARIGAGSSASGTQH